MRWVVFALCIFSFIPSVSAEWTFDEQRLNNCICADSCHRSGWNCGEWVACFYDPNPNDASPACRDIKNGPCRCEGYGCGRTQMIKSGNGYDKCLRENNPPVCRDGLCDTYRGENCSSCASDCGCFRYSECSGNGSKDYRGCTDKCQGVDCRSKCDGNKLYSGGKCDRDTKSCGYTVTQCKSRCDAFAGRCRDDDDK